MNALLFGLVVGCILALEPPVSIASQEDSDQDTGSISRLVKDSLQEGPIDALKKIKPPDNPYVECDSKKNTYLCVTEDKCISIKRKCDGNNDCTDGSDETQCPGGEVCREDEGFFKCGSGECISKYFRCDDEIDCHDKSDEENCSPFHKRLEKCNKGELKCQSSGLCLPEFWWCDGNMDCNDGTDEDKDTCRKRCTDFFCEAEGACLPNRWVCDGKNDCSDGSDEADGRCLSQKDSASCTLENGLFLCNDGKCIHANFTCDNVPHCDDKSDEGPLCKESCESHQCQQTCVTTPRGARCACFPGYNMTTKGECVDINECETFGKCSQVCINSPGSYECLCKESYHMDKENVCRAFHGIPLLLVSMKAEIRGLELRGRTPAYFQVHPNVTHTKQAIGIAFDSAEGRVFWSDVNKGKEGIFSGQLDGSNTDVFIGEGIKMVEDMAVDNIGRNLYFTESSNKFVGVASLRSKQWGVIIKASVEKPRGIAVFPPEGILFFTDWGSSPAVLTAGMDGSSVRPIVREGLEWPNGVTVDVAMQRIYWSDAKLNKLECAKFDGSDRHLVLSSIAKHPFSLSVFEDTLYWSDWHEKEVLSCNKFDGKNRTTLLKERNHTPYGIMISHPLLEPHLDGPNPCRRAGCSHMCLLAKRQDYQCFCPKGTKRISSKQCEEEQIVVNPRIILPFGRNSGGEVINAYVEDMDQFDDAVLHRTTRKDIIEDQPDGAFVPSAPPTSELSSSSENRFPDGVSTSSEFMTSAEETTVPDIPVPSGAEVQMAVQDSTDVKGIIIGIFLFLFILLLIGVFIYYAKKRQGSKPGVALRFRNPDFNRGRLSSAEELKNVQVLRSHNDGTYHNLATPTTLNPSGSTSLCDINNPKSNGPGLKRANTNPNVPSLYATSGASQRSDASSRTNTPLGQSPGTEDDFDDLEVYSANDKARLIP